MYAVETRFGIQIRYPPHIDHRRNLVAKALKVPYQQIPHGLLLLLFLLAGWPYSVPVRTPISASMSCCCCCCCHFSALPSFYVYVSSSRRVSTAIKFADTVDRAVTTTHITVVIIAAATAATGFINTNHHRRCGVASAYGSLFAYGSRTRRSNATTKAPAIAAEVGSSRWPAHR